MYVDYNSNEHGYFAQYARQQAGYYPAGNRRARREAEIAAHAAGVSQRPVLMIPGFDPSNGAPGLKGGWGGINPYPEKGVLP